MTFSAEDSLLIRFDSEGGDRGTLLGNAKVTYEDATLSAHSIEILFDLSELRAHSAPPDAGNVGRPQFTQGTESFGGESLAYNMETGRGRVVAAQTQFDDGFIHAAVAKVHEDSTVFIRGGLYTTCNCLPGETPSYSLRSRRMKIVDRKWVFTGPIQLFLFNIPTPVWLPFGFLPYQEGRRSGLLAPEYGEDERGFYLRSWGWYQVLGETMDLQLRAGIWTKGSFQVNPAFRYNRRDRYTGGLSIDYLRERSGERDDPDVVVRNNVSIRWTHSQTLNPSARMSANVNLTSSNYLKTVSDQYDDNVRQSVGSSVQYNKRYRSGRSLSLSLRHNQVLSSGATDLTLPELSLSQRTTTPFKHEGPSRDVHWYERFQYSYTGRMKNSYRFQPLTDTQLIAAGDTLANGTPVQFTWYEALFNRQKYIRATGRSDSPLDFRATHRVPISAPFTINRLPILGQIRLNLSPNFNFTENWFLETERQHVDSDGTLTRRTVAGFFSLRQFNTGVSANTTIYGLFPLRAGRYRGLRHTVRPRISYSYKPDFSSDRWGYSRAVLNEDGMPVIDTLHTGELIERRFEIASGVLGGLQQAVSFSVGNTFETKHVATDSTGEERSRVLKLFNVDVGSSWNYAADSLKMAPIQLSARTNVLGKLNLNLSSTFSPYALSADGTHIVNRFVFSARRFAFARMTHVSLRGSFQLRSQGSARADIRQQPQRAAFDHQTSSLGLNNPFASRAFEEPGGFSDWSLNVSFGYRISKPQSKVIRSATVNTRFDFNLTPTWKVRGQTGYDFERKKIVTTTLNVYKEFECWEMSMSWIPFGRFQSWGFDLHVKSGKLAEFLRLQQPRRERDRGFLR